MTGEIWRILYVFTEIPTAFPLYEGLYEVEAEIDFFIDALLAKKSTDRRILLREVEGSTALLAEAERLKQLPYYFQHC